MRLKVTRFFVMAGLVPAIHVLLDGCKDVDARHKAGHDEVDIRRYVMGLLWVRLQVDLSLCPVALTSSRSTEATPGPAIASHMKAAK